MIRGQQIARADRSPLGCSGSLFVSVTLIIIGINMNYLTFKSFISTEVLIIFYYLGALVLPIGIWYLLTWLIRKYRLLNAAYENGNELLWKALNIKQQTKFVAFFVISFLFMELFWRVFFEFLIAYMQIRDALLQTQL